MNDKAELKLILFVCFVACVMNFVYFVKHKPIAQAQPAHVCEVTSADLDNKLEHMMAEIYKLLAQRDNQIQGLQRQLYDKQNGRGKR